MSLTPIDALATDVVTSILSAKFEKKLCDAVENACCVSSNRATDSRFVQTFFNHILRLETSGDIDFASLKERELIVLFEYLHTFLLTLGHEFLAHWHEQCVKSLSHPNVQLAKVVVAYCRDLLLRDSSFADRIVRHYFEVSETRPFPVLDKLLQSYIANNPAQFYDTLNPHLTQECQGKVMKLLLTTAQPEGTHLKTLLSNSFWPRLLDLLETANDGLVFSSGIQALTMLLSSSKIRDTRLFIESCPLEDVKTRLFALFTRALLWRRPHTVAPQSRPSSSLSSSNNSPIVVGIKSASESSFEKAHICTPDGSPEINEQAKKSLPKLFVKIKDIPEQKETPGFEHLVEAASRVYFRRLYGLFPWDFLRFLRTECLKSQSMNEILNPILKDLQFHPHLIISSQFEDSQHIDWADIDSIYFPSESNTKDPPQLSVTSLSPSQLLEVSSYLVKNSYFGAEIEQPLQHETATPSEASIPTDVQSLKIQNKLLRNELFFERYLRRQQRERLRKLQQIASSDQCNNCEQMKMLDRLHNRAVPVSPAPLRQRKTCATSSTTSSPRPSPIPQRHSISPLVPSSPVASDAGSYGPSTLNVSHFLPQTSFKLVPTSSKRDSLVQRYEQEIKNLDRLAERQRREIREIKTERRKWENDVLLKLEKTRSERSRLSEHVLILDRQQVASRNQNETLSKQLNEAIGARKILENKIQLLHNEIEDTNANNETIECLTAQLYQKQLAHDQYVQDTLSGILKDRDAVIKELQDSLIKSEERLNEMMEQVQQEDQKVNTMLLERKEDKLALETAKSALDFQRRVSKEMLEAVDRKYETIKRINVGLYQRIAELERDLHHASNLVKRKSGSDFSRQNSSSWLEKRTSSAEILSAKHSNVSDSPGGNRKKDSGKKSSTHVSSSSGKSNISSALLGLSSLLHRHKDEKNTKKDKSSS